MNVTLLIAIKDKSYIIFNIDLKAKLFGEVNILFGFFKRESIDEIDVNEIDSLPGKIHLIDIREPFEYKRGHLAKAKSIPMNNILAETDKYLEPSEIYYIICQTGSRSIGTCRRLKKIGYNVINVSGGTSRYKGKLIK